MSQIVITPLLPDDAARWQTLWRGYLEFYQTSLPAEIYDHTWQRLLAPDSAIRGFGARDGADGKLTGIVHYLFHAHAWSTKDVCYLQDLYVDAAVRGHGAGRLLIEAVAAAAREHDCLRLYWTTKQDNTTARLLYDRVARFNGFVRYDYTLG